MAQPYNPRFNRRNREPEHRINHLIRVAQVRLVGENIQTGIYSTGEALKISQELGVDLVEIVPTANPPVCKAIDYKKFLYEKKKKEKEQKSKQSKNITKEIRFTPNTDDHDFDFKSNHAENFLKEGAKVRAYVQFRGRHIAFKDRGELLLLKFIKRLEEFGSPENLPKLEGKRMFVTFNPKSHK